MPQFCADPKCEFLYVCGKGEKGGKELGENYLYGSGIWVHKLEGDMVGSAGKIGILCGKIAVRGGGLGIDRCAGANFVSECGE